MVILAIILIAILVMVAIRSIPTSPEAFTPQVTSFPGSWLKEDDHYRWAAPGDFFTVALNDSTVGNLGENIETQLPANFEVFVNSTFTAKVGTLVNLDTNEKWEFAGKNKNVKLSKGNYQYQYAVSADQQEYIGFYCSNK